MPNLPKPRFGRSARARGEVVTPPEPQAPNVEIVEGAGLRWINIERPRAVDRAWLEEHFDFHPLDYEDVFSRNQRPKVDEYDGYLFIVLHFPAFDKTVGRLNAAELDLFVGPDFLITLPNEPLQPVEYLFERCRAREEFREQLFSKGPGYLLYKIVDECVDASFPMLRKMGNKLERLEDDIFEGRSEEIVRDISNVKQEIINFRKIVRPQRTALQRPRAHQAALHRRGPRHLLRRHRRRLRARLGHARELQGGHRGAGVHQRVGDLASLQRHPADPDGLQHRVPAGHAHREHLGHERRAFPAAGTRRARRTPSSGSSSAAMVALLAGMIAYFKKRRWL